MSWYGGYGDWAPYVPVAKKIARGHAAAKKLAKKEGRDPLPVKIDGRKFAKTFWGLKWCENLERYHDYANRLPRGATYVRNGSVADLVIESGRIRAIVGGSEAYTIEIKIQTLKPAAWKAILHDCAQEIESLLDLLQGRFSDGAMQRLTRAEDGMFPGPREIAMRCSCPDSAGVCKHIAATFYGVAARLDTQPELLFKLRSVDHLELISQAATAENLDRVLNGQTDTAFAGGDLGQIFGIELDSSASTNPPKKVSKRTRQKPATPTKTEAVEPVVARKAGKSIRKIEPGHLPPKPAVRSAAAATEKPVRSRKSATKVALQPAAKFSGRNTVKNSGTAKTSISTGRKRAAALASAKPAPSAKRLKKAR